MTKKIHKKIAGFTLMEMMVVVAIISILTIGILANVTDSRRQKQVLAAQREVISVLKETQNFSLSGTGASPECDNVFIFDADPTSENYKIDGCRDVQYKLENGVIFSSDSADRVGFCTPHGKLADLNSSDPCDLESSFSGTLPLYTVERGSEYKCSIGVGGNGRVEDRGCTFNR